MRLRISVPVTALTFHQRIRAVEFDQTFRAGAGEAMKSVDVLRDNGAEFPRSFQTDDGIMDRVRPGIAEALSSFELVIPMLDSRRFGHHEILKIDWLSPHPDTLRSTKIRNAAAGRNACACEDQRFL